MIECDHGEVHPYQSRRLSFYDVFQLFKTQHKVNLIFLIELLNCFLSLVLTNLIFLKYQLHLFMWFFFNPISTQGGGSFWHSCTMIPWNNFSVLSKGPCFKDIVNNAKMHVLAKFKLASPLDSILTVISNRKLAFLQYSGKVTPGLQKMKNHNKGEPKRDFLTTFRK